MNLQEKFLEVRQRAEEGLKQVKDIDGLELFKNKFLGRKAGLLTLLMSKLESLTLQEKKQIGVLANRIKAEIENLAGQKEKEIEQNKASVLLEEEFLDATQPSLPVCDGGRFHPVTIVQDDLEDFFSSMGFMILDGPEIESDYYNFTAVNIPETHPARDMQDTFYIKNHPNWLMRTHTSSMQVRALEQYGAPLRVIVPGRCFRNEATDARHEHTFDQLEGFVVDKTTSFTDMKGALETVAKRLYGEKTQTRLRPKFYPFVEPGVNVEVSCFLCEGKGCRLCKRSGWLEIAGAGMIHPNVLKAGGINPKVYQGFAFGFGLTRLAMLKYGIDDVRLFLSGDLRFLKQF